MSTALAVITKHDISHLFKWFKFHQNNSGGSCIEDENVAKYVYIEAVSAADANSRAENIGIYFGGTYDGRDCRCCGDRWYEAEEVDTPEDMYPFGWNGKSYGAGFWGEMDTVPNSQEYAVFHFADGSKKYGVAVFGE